MKFYAIFFILFIHSCSSFGSKKKTYILFIGNSLTSYNGMPQTLQTMLNEHAEDFVVQQLTVDGSRLTSFATEVEIEKDTYQKAKKDEVPFGVKAILARKWDYVVLQEGGNDPLIPYSRIYSFEPAVLFLNKIIKSIGAHTVLSERYTASNYPHQNCESQSIIEYDRFDRNTPVNALISNCSPIYNTSAEEYSDIGFEFNKMAKKTNAHLVRVGYAFEQFKKRYAKYNLYGDGGHPSATGSYLIACVFYKYFTNKTLTDIKYRATLNRDVANTVKMFVTNTKL